MSKKLNAAVLGSGPLAYDMIRLLNRRSIKTYLLTYKQKLNCNLYPDTEILKCPSPLNIELFKDIAIFFNENLAVGKNVVLIPATDEFALFLAQKRDQLDKRFQYVQPNSALTEAIDNKMLFDELCRQNKIPCPKTVVVRNNSEFESALQDISFPCIVKPLRTRDWPKFAGFKVRIIKEKEELKSFINELLLHGCEILIQDMIPGGPETVFFIGGLYDENSNPIKLYVGQKILQYPLGYGTLCYGHLKWNDDIVSLANSFIKSIGYSGLIDIEFKYDQRDRTFKMIEINPRNGLFHSISDDGSWDISSFYVNWISEAQDIMDNYEAHQEGRKWIYPHVHLYSRIEERGFFKGIKQWHQDMHLTGLKCEWDTWNIHLCYRHFRVVLGHIRRLGLKILISGKNSDVYKDVNFGYSEREK